MSSEAADALGLSRAILCNGKTFRNMYLLLIVLLLFTRSLDTNPLKISDSMVKKLDELENNTMMFKALVGHVRQILKTYFNLARVYKGYLNFFV